MIWHRDHGVFHHLLRWLGSLGQRYLKPNRLVDALGHLSARGARPVPILGVPSLPPPTGHRFHLSPRAAFFAPSEHLPLAKAEGRTCSDIVTIYPPGIPVLVPGEEIGSSTIDYLLSLASHGARIDGVLELDEPQIRVLRD